MKRTLLFALSLLILVACGESTPKEKSSTPITYGETIALLQPDLSEGLTINEALSLRCSSREYSEEPLSLEELSGVMWAAAGINRPGTHYLTAPSAMALYPIETYAFTPEGVYRYDAETHTLALIVKGDHRPLSAAQEFAYTAPLNLVYIANLGRYEGYNLPTEKALFLAGQDAAGYAENVNLYAAGHNLKAITRGSLKSDEVLKLLSLGENFAVVLAQTVGK